MRKYKAFSGIGDQAKKIHRGGAGEGESQSLQALTQIIRKSEGRGLNLYNMAPDRLPKTT